MTTWSGDILDEETKIAKVCARESEPSALQGPQAASGGSSRGAGQNVPQSLAEGPGVAKPDGDPRNLQSHISEDRGQISSEAARVAWNGGPRRAPARPRPLS